MANYVKFQRGSLAAYNRLKDKDLLDDNTLYFIYTDDNSSAGSLYMGDKIISTGEVVEVAKKLSTLEDVSLSNLLANNFLVFNGTSWVNKKLTDIQSLILSGTDVDELSQQLENLKNQIGHAADESQNIAATGIYTEFVPVTSNRLLTDSQISKLNALIISDDTNPIIGNRIALNNVINLSEALAAKADSSRVGNLESQISDLSAVINNCISLEKYTNEVGNLTQLLNYNSNNPTTLVDEINDINSRLTWQEISNN